MISLREFNCAWAVYLIFLCVCTVIKSTKEEFTVRRGLALRQQHFVSSHLQINENESFLLRCTFFIRHVVFDDCFGLWSNVFVLKKEQQMLNPDYENNCISKYNAVQ